MRDGIDPGAVGHLRVNAARFGEEQEWGAIALAFQGADRRRAAGFWRFGPGEFSFEPNHDEVLYVIEGRVTVDFADDRRLLIQPGDLVYLPERLEGRWRAEGPVRAAFCSISTDEALDY